MCPQQGLMTSARVTARPTKERGEQWCTRLIDLDRFEVLTLSRFVHLAHDMGHAGFEAEEGRHLYGLGFVIHRERLDLATVTGTPLTGQEARRAVTRRMELPVRLKWSMGKFSSFESSLACCQILQLSRVELCVNLNNYLVSHQLFRLLDVRMSHHC